LNAKELKQEVGLGDFDGRGWRGFHHHATLCIAAYGFLISHLRERPAFSNIDFLRAVRAFQQRRFGDQVQSRMPQLFALHLTHRGNLPFDEVFGSDNNAERYILASGAPQQTAIIPSSGHFGLRPGTPP
jgi:hypothetical protein